MTTSIRSAALNLERSIRHDLGREIRRARPEAGLSQRAVAAAAGLDHGTISRLEAGLRMPELGNLARISIVIGAPLQWRLRPGSGPLIRDRLQAPRIEALLSSLDRRWQRHVEVAVGRPDLGGGVIDLVLAHPSERLLVAVEACSRLEWVEQTLRWGAQKADRLRYHELARRGPAGRLRIERVLLLGATAHDRAIARELDQTLSAAYPATLADTLAALQDISVPLPGSALVWTTVDASRPRLLSRPPAGVGVGRRRTATRPRMVRP